ncbi:hypothetical protein A2U01_0100219, partial [Trifolium medium]|nr:hypothetical protein [Trifolium medium]
VPWPNAQLAMGGSGREGGHNNVLVFALV